MDRSEGRERSLCAMDRPQHYNSIEKPVLMRFYLNGIIFVRTHWNLMRLEPKDGNCLCPLQTSKMLWYEWELEWSIKENVIGVSRRWRSVWKMNKRERQGEREWVQGCWYGVQSQFYLPNTQRILRVKHYWKATIKPPASKPLLLPLSPFHFLLPYPHAFTKSSSSKRKEGWGAKTLSCYLQSQSYKKL